MTWKLQKILLHYAHIHNHSLFWTRTGFINKLCPHSTPYSIINISCFYTQVPCFYYYRISSTCLINISISFRVIYPNSWYNFQQSSSLWTCNGRVLINQTVLETNWPYATKGAKNGHLTLLLNYKLEFKDGHISDSSYVKGHLILLFNYKSKLAEEHVWFSTCGNGKSQLILLFLYCAIDISIAKKSSI